MTREQFLMIPFKEQCLVIEDFAVLVAERADVKFRYYLFQLDSFYIEISIQLHNEIIEGIYPFSSMELLDKYLLQIDISRAMS
ncbi:MAG: hypothetical protein QM737_15750 [Ferruginibacter sp.]